MNQVLPQLEPVLAHCPGIDPAAVADILSRFDPDYFEVFDARTIARHIGAFLMLSAQQPAAVLLGQRDGLIDCTILAFDRPFEFSSITGIMASTGLSIESCDAFTLRAAPAGRPAVPSARRRHSISIRRRDPRKDPLILDHFTGRLVESSQTFKQWSRQFEPAIMEIMRLLDQDDEQSTERGKRLINERVTQWLRQRGNAPPGPAGLASGQVTIEQLPQATRLRLHAPDAPAFLYALSTALALHGLQIQKTRAQTLAGQAIDQIDVVDSRGKPVNEQDCVDQLRLSVLLTQQFAYFLDRAPDPFTAMRRFEELSKRLVQTAHRAQWLELLANPLSMVDLAKVLGASDYLWEDVIRFHAEVLLPLFQRHAQGRELCPPARSLPRRLEESIRGTRNFDQQRSLLNQFKDHELFLIDLDHILASENPDAAFQILSERLVQLAEHLVALAARLARSEMLRLYGQPRDDRGADAHFAIFGLGKLGGVALGYASDIELLFLYDSDGKTVGGARGSLPNDEFFAILARETCDYIQAKREGIFHIDLRLRPYGKSGPLACGKQRFADYYSSGGQAHPFERLALVRLRWIAGQSRLGYQIERLRDELLYGSAITERDLDAIWDISAKMRAQHSQPRRLNSKYSPGGLIDLEGTVQLLQVMHGGQAPQLQTPRLHEVIQGLHRAGILSAIEFDDLMAAYQFLRRLINAQRMLRGSAQDLFLPPETSDELAHLARRMNYVPDQHESSQAAAALVQQFHHHTRMVRQFVRNRFGRPVPGEAE